MLGRANRWGSGTAGSLSVGVEELAGAEESETLDLAEALKALVAGDDDVGSGFERAFQNPIIGIVIGKNVHTIPRRHEAGERPDQAHRRMCAKGRPAKLADEHVLELLEEWWRDKQLDVARSPEAQDLFRDPTEVEGGQIHVGIRDDAEHYRPARYSRTRRSTSVPVTPRRRACSVP